MKHHHEKNLVFRTQEQWREWVGGDGSDIYSGELTDSLIDAVKKNGIIEPLSNRSYSPDEILVNGRNYRETIKAGNLISRNRAILLALVEYERTFKKLIQGRNCKVYAPEALTDFALYLRSRFPRFIGSEYAETPSEKAAIWPIVSEDLTALTFPKSSFDVVVTSDVLEHVPDLDRSLAEIHRVLLPEGVTLSTFPFSFLRKGIQRARLERGQLIHILSPQYHGNPMRPDEGSLVFEVPGWDIVDRSLSAGFSDAFFYYVRSARSGVVSADINGILVFVAIK
jgi:SAM-dependent methyltransferase